MPTCPCCLLGTDVFADSNFAPVILQNGSLVGLMRKTSIYAQHWKDVSTYRVSGPFHDHGEDPYVWMTPSAPGIFHAIIHHQRTNTHGLHYFSEDGVNWHVAQNYAYNITIAYTDGSKQDLGCRERPHIVQDRHGDVVALTNGASPITCHNAGSNDYSFTSLQKVRQQRRT